MASNNSFVLAKLFTYLIKKWGAYMSKQTKTAAQTAALVPSLLPLQLNGTF